MAIKNRKNSRKLTPNEIREAKKVFSDTIDYDKVRIVKAKYIFLQKQNYAISPDGNIYFPKSTIDWTLPINGNNLAELLIHEMTHIYQYQRGHNVLIKAGFLQFLKFLSFGLYNPYKFKYQLKKPFSSYNLEQQGDIAVEIYKNKLPNTIL